MSWLIKHLLYFSECVKIWCSKGWDSCSYLVLYRTKAPKVCGYLIYFFLTRSPAKGAIAIRRIFSLVAHDYKDRIFKLVQMFCNLHGSVGKCINFSIGVTSQQFVAFKLVQICVFRTHLSFSRFHTGYSFDQISRKCRNAEVLFKGINAEM